MEIKLLKYPKKSRRKAIKLPTESIKLAELMGAEFGDGGINNPWQLIITLNAKADREYSIYLANLLKELFEIDVRTRVRNENTLTLVSSSTNLIDFLVDKGAVRGNKISQSIDMPPWIRKNSEYQKYFVRGLVDTDGCLYIHRKPDKTPKSIGLCFTSFSKPLIQSVAQTLQAFGIKPHIAQNSTRIYLYSQKAVVEYLSIFGSSNPRIRDKYFDWRGRIVA